MHPRAVGSHHTATTERGQSLGTTLGQIAPLAIGIGVNPLPIIAIILMLLTPTARANGWLFIGGWLVGLLAVGAIAIAIANHTSLYDSEGSALARWLRVLFGILVLGLAVRQWLGRPKPGEDPPPPAWMSALATYTPAKSFRLGALLAGANPKNLAFTLAAVSGIVEAGLTVGEEAVLFGIFTVIATVGVATPLGVYLLLGERAPAVLEGWGAWLSRHSATIMSVVLLVIGLLLLAKGITG